MHEVKVYDSSGNLKEVVSARALKKRADQMIESPLAFRKRGKKANPQTNITTVKKNS